MKAMQFSLLTLIFVTLLFLSDTFAQDYTRWGLPEGAKARLGKGWISGNIAYSPDGTRLAVASSIGIWLYDTGTYQEVALLTGHTNRVYSVAFSPDGNTLASGGGSQDMTSLRLWDVTTGQSTATLTGHEWVVYSVAFSPDGNTLASGSVFPSAYGMSSRVNTSRHSPGIRIRSGALRSARMDGRLPVVGVGRMAPSICGMP